MEFVRKNNERPETFSSSGRPGSPPPELLTNENNLGPGGCLWHFRATASKIWTRVAHWKSGVYPFGLVRCGVKFL
jgi:hypothetical protein